jgi:glycosyltransferase involved in cell wall biosynthesis
LDKFQRVLVPSKRALEIYASFGITNKKWQVIPHSVNYSEAVDSKKTDKFVFIGRLTQEKGIEKILDLWPSTHRIDVIGDGDLDKSKYVDRREISFLGKVPRAEILRLVSTYKAMIFSSSSPESALPLVALESIFFGLPIISVDQNTVADAILEGDFGLVLPPDYNSLDLALCIKVIEQNLYKYSMNAKRYSKENHNYSSWLLKYKSLYTEVINEWKLSKSLKI